DVMAKLRPRDVVELGPGSCRKVRWLFDPLEDAEDVRYVAVDVGRDSLVQAVTALGDRYPKLHVHAVVGDFGRHLECLPRPVRRRLVLFLGSTIGHFDTLPPPPLLAPISRLLRVPGRLLLELRR